MKRLLVLLLVLLITSTGFAQGERMRLVKPKSSSEVLTLLQLQRKPDLVAQFNGQVWVAGTFVVRWPAGKDARVYREPDYLLIPDSVSTAQLPHFVYRDGSYVGSYKVRTITVQNGKEAAGIAFVPGDVERILQRKVNSVSVTGRFLIEAYSVGVECDAPWAKAVLVKAELPGQLALAHRKVLEGC